MSRPTLPRAARTAALAAAAAAGLAACGHSPSTTLHVLTAAAPAAAPFAYAGPPVRVDSVHLPAALDRLELLRETAPGRYAVEEFDRWAAPPSRLARETLAQDLALRLPGAVITGAGGPGPVVAVSAEVRTFTSGPGGSAMDADWTRGCGVGRPVRRASARLEAPGSADPAEALGMLLARLADRVAADLAAAPDLGCPAAPPVRPPG